jgi:LCP family protein required for cell wall assembly
MTYDRTEQLIRDVFADEAAGAVDPRQVLAGVRGKKPRKSYGLMLTTAAIVVVVAAVATFVVPEVFKRSSATPPVGSERQQEQTAAITPTNVLVIGTDTTGYTDSIVLTQIAADGSVNLVSLPRDSWVSSAGKDVRLNQIYRTAGADALLAAVSDLTGVTVDHYLAVDMAVFRDLANAVGGVEVCLLSATKDNYAGANFPAGKQTVSGDAALAFVRQRHNLPNGDLDRIVRLQAFLQSLATKLKGTDLDKLLGAIQGKVTTDPNLDLLGLAQALAGMKALHVGTIPIGNIDSPAAGGGGSVIEVDPAQVKQFVTDLPSTPPATGDVPCVN